MTINGETVVAIVGALGGGLLVKFLDRLYQLKEKTVDVKEHQRQDAREDIAVLRKELDELRDELDVWKEKYYALFQETALLKAQIGLLNINHEQKK